MNHINCAYGQILRPHILLLACVHVSGLGRVATLGRYYVFLFMPSGMHIIKFVKQL